MVRAKDDRNPWEQQVHRGRLRDLKDEIKGGEEPLLSLPIMTTLPYGPKTCSIQLSSEQPCMCSTLILRPEPSPPS